MKTHKFDSTGPEITLEDPLSGFKGFVIIMALVILTALSFMLYHVREEVGLALVIVACGFAAWLLCRGIATIYQARAMVKHAEHLTFYLGVDDAFPPDIAIIGDAPLELEDRRP